MTNEERLYAALTLALADENFMGNNSSVRKAIEALTPKSTATAVLKRLQGNALRDFLEKKDAGVVGFTEEARAEKIKGYVQERFKAHMEAPKTSVEATKLFNAAYPSVAASLVDSGLAESHADDEG